MNTLIVLSLVVVGCLAAPAPQFIQPGVTLQTGQLPATIVGTPTFLTSQQLFAQPAFITQPIAQEEQAGVHDQPSQLQTAPEQVDQSAALRDPSNPTTDVLLHSGFPFVASLGGIQSGLASPFSLTSAPLARVGINSARQPAQTSSATSSQLISAQPAQSTLQAQTHQAFTIPTLSSASTIPASNTAQLSGTPIFLTTASQAQPLTGIRTVATPFTFASPFQTVVAQ